MIYFQSLTRKELETLILPLSRLRSSQARDCTQEQLDLKLKKQAAYRAKQIFNWVYQRFITDWDQMTDLSKELRSWLKENVEFYQLKQKVNQTSTDGTQKFLWNLDDQKTIESVIIPAALQEKSECDFEQEQRYKGISTEDKDHKGEWTRLTACISSQVGCAMGCKFCLTGIQGLDRHLKTHEIITQVFELKKIAPLTNIVFMGMGEPLHNVDAVIAACQILVDDNGMNFSKRKVIVSTSGLVPNIKKLGETIDVSLAVSLNGTYDEQREKVMPVNKRWNIKELMQACRNYPTGPHRKITFEYVLLKDVNDSLDDAKRLVTFTKNIPSKINLIPFNEHSGASFKRSSDQTVKAFHRYLLDKKVTATVRISRGQDILAACGQLRSLFGTARGTEKHKDFSPSV